MKKKIEVIEQARQLIENDLSFDALQKNELKLLIGGSCTKTITCTPNCIGVYLSCGTNTISIPNPTNK